MGVRSHNLVNVVLDGGPSSDPVPWDSGSPAGLHVGGDEIAGGFVSP